MENNMSNEQKRMSIQGRISGDFTEQFANIKMNNAIRADDGNINTVMDKLKYNIDEILEDKKYTNEMKKSRVYELIDNAKAELKRTAEITREDEFENKYTTIIQNVHRQIDYLYDEPDEDKIQRFSTNITNVTQNSFQEESKKSSTINSQNNADILLNMKYNILRNLNIDGLSEVDIKNAINRAEEKLNEYYAENSDIMDRNLNDVVNNIQDEVIEQCQKDYEFGQYSKERQEDRKKLADMFK